LPKKNGYDDWMNVGMDFSKYIGSGKKGSSDDFFSYIDTGENYGDYTERPTKSRKGRPKISNNPNEFGISLQALGDASISSVGSIQRGRKINRERRKKLNELYEEKRIKGYEKEGKILKRGQHLESYYDRTKKAIKQKIAQRHTTNTLKKYYHPKEKKPEREEKQEQSQRFKNQRDMR